MDKDTLIGKLKTTSDVNTIVSMVIEDNELLPMLFDLTFSLSSALRFKCTKIIRIVSEQKPEMIYPHFDIVVKMIRQENSFIKWDGITILSNLVSVDYEKKFAQIYNEYLFLIKDPHMITAANVVGNCWKIVLADPKLDADITAKLCEVPSILYIHDNKPSPECNAIVCGKVLECFDRYYDISVNHAQMIDFAKTQLNSRRASVIKIAQKFLKKYAK